MLKSHHNHLPRLSLTAADGEVLVIRDERRSGAGHITTFICHLLHGGGGEGAGESGWSHCENNKYMIQHTERTFNGNKEAFSDTFNTTHIQQY